MAAITLQCFVHQDTSTFSWLIADQSTRQAAIVDPVLDYDPQAARTGTAQADAMLDWLRSQALELVYVLETHAHADHLSSADYLRRQTGARIVIGKPIVQVQETFARIFNEPEDFHPDGHQFDLLVQDGDELTLGQSTIRVLNTPGHTPACVTYVVNDTDAFVGDTLFMPDVGTARCDFPGGDAGVLFDSVQRLLALGDEVRLHLCHDYPPTERPLEATVTVARQKEANIHVHTGIDRDTFIRMRNQRDATLAVPRLILPSLQVNIRAGAFPAPDNNGVSYLKVPLNLL